MNNVDWRAIQADYEAGSMSLRELAARHGVSKTYLIERRNKEHWQKTTTDRPTTDNTGGKTPDINAAVRVHAALKIYLEERPTWDEIASRSGFSSRGAAHNAVSREMSRRIDHDVQRLREEDLFMLQGIQARCYKAAMDEGNKDWTWAADRFATFSKRKSELMGLDVKPEEQLVNQNYTKRIVLDRGDQGDNSADD